MRKTTGIYKIQSLVKPERFYIGSAVNISKRWRDHRYKLRLKTHDNPKLQAHYNKYGEVDLQFSVLLGCDKDDLIKIEQYFIDSYNPWFNICKIANSRIGVIVSQETRQKQRLAKIGTKQSKETIERRKISIGEPWNKGKKASPEIRLKLSLSHKGQTSWNKGKKGFMKGRVTSEETKTKMRKAAKGRVISLAQRLKISNTLKNKNLQKQIV